MATQLGADDFVDNGGGTTPGGGENTNPDDNPTPNEPKVVSLNYTGDTVFMAGDDNKVTVTATYDDGTTQEIEVTDDMYVVDEALFKPDMNVPAKYKVKIAYQNVSTDVLLFKVVDPSSDVLISNSDFVYGAYYDLDRGDGVSMMAHGDYVKGKTSHTLLERQDVTIKVTDTDLSKYKVTVSYFDAAGNYKGRSGIIPMVNGELSVSAGSINGTHFRISVYIYSPFTKIPESASINVYKEPISAEKIDENVLISNKEFVYGSYYDLNKGDGVSMMTSGDYAKGKTAHTLLEKQDVTVKVLDTDLSKYKVTVSYFDAAGNYKGRSGIIEMVNGVLDISASSIPTTHFRISVYIYSPFTRIPDDATINVYKKTTYKSWEGSTISILGDSISTGGYTSILGNMTGATIDNNAVSGTTVTGTGGLVAQLKNIDENADLIIIFGATNDYWRKNISIGSLSDEGTGTYLGAMKHILQYLETNHPDAEYLFIFPYDQHFGGNNSDVDFGKGTLDDFRSAFLAFCDEYDLDHIDLGDTDFDCNFHSNDGVHPNSTGHQIIAEAIYEHISVGK
jgi:lysophospholipase L1-like esterase